MTTAEVEALLRLLAEWEREELELVMRERRKPSGRAGCISNQTSPVWRGIFLTAVPERLNADLEARLLFPTPQKALRLLPYCQVGDSYGLRNT